MTWLIFQENMQEKFDDFSSHVGSCNLLKGESGKIYECEEPCQTDPWDSCSAWGAGAGPRGDKMWQ